MSRVNVNIRELAAWGFDDATRNTADPDHRGRKAQQSVAGRASFMESSALIPNALSDLNSRVAPLLQREDLQNEYRGLQWDIGVVDLRKLLAFQRRIIIDPDGPALPEIRQDDWDGLLTLAFDGRRSTEVSVRQTRLSENERQIVLGSRNPDLSLRVEPGAEQLFRLHGGSPFFEVAHYRGRWFLRDGYHRAYALIGSGIHAAFAAVIHARTMAEVGAVKPWFFDEQVLFSERPPMVTDFHDDAVVLSYSRARMSKRITVRIEEELQPADAKNQ